MSVEQDYFPPKGSKWVWTSKHLATSGWACDLAKQMSPSQDTWPMSVILRAELIGDKFYWRVEIIGWHHERSSKRGSSRSALKALLAAEKAGEEAFTALMPEWTRTALANRWRPCMAG